MDEPYARAVRDERVELLFRHAPFILATTLLISAILALLASRQGYWHLALPWWLGVALFAIARIGVARAYRRSRGDGQVPWHRIMTLTTGLSGLVWGSAGVLFFVPQEPLLLTFTTIFLAGMAAGSSSSLSAYPPAYYAYAVPTMLPVALRYLAEGESYALMGAICLVFLANILVFGRNISEMVGSAIRLRFTNTELVEQLWQEKRYAEEQREKAEAASQAKTRFLAAASHDLRQPLHAINLFVEALRHEQDTARMRTIAEHLQGTAGGLEGLLNELLDISKLEAGLFKPEIRAFPLQSLFETLEREFRPIAEEKGLAIKFMPTQLVVESDFFLLARLVRNIVANAVRYTDQGVILVGVRRRAGGAAAIAVYDTGPGIAPEHQRAIFREFYQLGNPERDRRKGLGLGLAIVEGLARLLGQYVELKSLPGHGSVFFVTVAPACEAPAREAAAEPDLGDMRGLRVLVIDDEPTILLAMQKVLEAWGCHYLGADSAAEALELLTREGALPEVMVVDFRLREGRTGVEAIAAVRERFGPIPAVLLTGDTAPERLKEASSGGYLLLHKPLQPARLRAAFRSIREGRRPERNAA